MILHTIVPPELLFEETERAPLIRASLGGVSVLIEPIGEGEGRIERLLSTDPQHFLQPHLQPGTIVKLM